MTLLEKLNSSVLFFDGGTGTVLQGMGLLPGESCENWNITNPEKIAKLHEDYLLAGSDIIKTNTFGANPIKTENYAELIKAALKIANAAREKVNKNSFIAFDIGPLGKMIKPLGDLSFEDAVDAFKKSIEIGAKCGADLILIETMSDLCEAKAAVIAAKETSDLPIFLSFAYDENEKLLTGATPECVGVTFDSLGISAIGVNCSLGPRQMKPIIKRLMSVTNLPIIVNPNAGIPYVSGLKTVFPVGEDEYLSEMLEIRDMGASILGGCCGTTPKYIEKLTGAVKDRKYKGRCEKLGAYVSSYSHVQKIGGGPLIVGERLNPTGKAKMREAIMNRDFAYLQKEAISQAECGAAILDLNVGIADIDEKEVLKDAVYEVCKVSDLPIQIDSSNPDAIEAALRIYCGRAIVNSVSGAKKSLDSVLPIVKKYGAMVIGLCLDENGIPKTAKGRQKIAEKIVRSAEKYGIDKKDIVIDPLAMTVSTENDGAKVALETIRLVKEKLGVLTAMGVSNISFGLPKRECVTAAFLSMAIESGLDMAIANPKSDVIMQSFYAASALSGFDKNCENYIKNATGDDLIPDKIKDEEKITLEYAIIRGIESRAKSEAAELIKSESAIEIINESIIPALDYVGVEFENKRMFLPQLLMSAEAAKAAFDAVKTEKCATSVDKIAIATVKGDIHDIGKNIVKMLLENYGFSVCDLGRDVPPEKIKEFVLKNGIKLLGLSALMTTTVPAMEETIALIKKECPDTKCVVGGAVLTPEYAKKIGADFSAKDAMCTVRVAQKIFNKV